MVYFIGAWVAIVFVAVAVREIRRRRRLRPLRTSQETEDVVYRTAVTLKLDRSVLWAPKWALGAAGFVLVVRTGSVQILGPGASNSWYFEASDVTVEAERSRTPWGRTKGWIRIEAPDSNQPVRLSISPFPKPHVVEAWNALLSSGAQARSGPPPV
jgi:hypothetical protein